MSKALRQEKIREDRYIYISWLHGKEDDGRTRWVDLLQVQLKVDTQTRKRLFPNEPRRTGDEIPGDPVRLHGPKGVTDMICALTNPYLEANQKGPAPDNVAELAEFIRIKNSLDPQDRQRVWLAPLNPVRYHLHRVEKIDLSDVAIFWLHRLKEDGKRFALPSPQVNPSDVDEDIFRAAMEILGESEDEEGEPT